MFDFYTFQRINRCFPQQHTQTQQFVHPHYTSYLNDARLEGRPRPQLRRDPHPRVQRGRHVQGAVHTEAGALRPVDLIEAATADGRLLDQHAGRPDDAVRQHAADERIVGVDLLDSEND